MSTSPAVPADTMVDERSMTAREKGVCVSDSAAVMTFQPLAAVRVDDFCFGGTFIPAAAGFQTEMLRMQVPVTYFLKTPDCPHSAGNTSCP